MPRRAVSSWLGGVLAKRSWLICLAKVAWSWMSARSALTSSATRPAEFAEAMGAWETKWAPKAQQRIHTAPSTRDGPERPLAVIGRDPHDPTHRKRHQHE